MLPSIPLLLACSLAAMPINLPDFMVNEKYRFLYLEPFRSIPLQIIYGGSSSGKSADISQRLVMDVVNEPRNVLVVRNTANTLRDSVFAELERAINRLQVRPLFDISQAALNITYKPRGNRFFFRGLDDTEKLKGIVPSVGVLTDQWFEEITEMAEKDVDDVGLRLRGQATVPKRQFYSFNPIYVTHWLAKKLFKQRLIQYYNDGRMLVLHTTHRDNQFLDPADHARLEAYTGYHHDVYADGKWGVLGSLIFTNWKVDDLSRFCPDLIRHGLDFGFAADPSAYLQVGLDRAKKKIYILKEFYRHGLTNDLLAAAVRPYCGHEAVVRCDSAEPKSIEELRVDKKNRINAVGVKKGPDSVLHGIQWLQQYEIIVDRLCQHTQNELTTFQWKKNRQGEDLPEPIGYNDHCIAALRYALEDDMLEKQLPGIYVIG